MKKYLIILTVFFAAVALQAQLLYESFNDETFPPTGWTLNDADGDGYNWQSGSFAHEGPKCASSYSRVYNVGPLTPDNWLITPQLSIPNDGCNYLLEWYAAAQDREDFQEHYGVYISTTDTNPSSFTSVYEETMIDTNWEYRGVILDAATYSGQQIYVAFRHWNCTGMYILRLDEVKIAQASTSPAYSLFPSTWDFWSVELMNPTAKRFRLQNTGSGILTINSIELDTQAEVNFTCDATFPQNLAAGEYYDFNVTFTPLTGGMKSATLKLTEGANVHNHVLTGHGIGFIAPYNLTGEVSNDSDVVLNWGGDLYGNPGFDSWLHWDNGNIQTGMGLGPEWTAATKFASTEYGAYAGMQITKIAFVTKPPEPGTTITAKVWTGTDANLAPTSEITSCSTVATEIVEGWNEVTLNNPYTIQGTEAIYIGIQFDGMNQGLACDSGPIVLNRGGIIRDSGGYWNNIYEYLPFPFNYNFKLRTYIEDPAKRGSDLSRYPQPIQTASLPSLSQSGNFPEDYRSDSSEPKNDRELIGFHVYRNDSLTPITSTPLEPWTWTYTDTGLAPGIYTYKVRSVHTGGYGSWSNKVVVTVGSDVHPPIITHLPVLNTPRADLQPLVVADIRDDAIWNNPIESASLYYSTDGGSTYNPAVDMIAHDDTTYYALIPAQPLETTVTYYLQARDSEGNLSQTDTFSFEVNDPVWVRYDNGTPAGAIWYSGNAWSPLVLFQNPCYDTANPLKIYSSDGIVTNATSQDPIAATLQIYRWDGTNPPNLVPYFDTPLPVTFDHYTYEVFDLSSYDIQITDPYFLLSYNLPGHAAFWCDTTFNYGTSYSIYQGELYYIDDGDWMMGVKVGKEVLGVEAPTISIALDGSYPTISWDEVAGAQSYNVYGSNDPYAALPWTAIESGIGDLGYTYQGTEPYRFFYVTASTELNGSKMTHTDPVARINSLSRIISARSIKSHAMSELSLPAATIRNK